MNRINDQPAIIKADGQHEWYIDGKLNRINDYPSIIRPNGHMEWLIKGKHKRLNDNNPVIFYSNGFGDFLVNNKMISCWITDMNQLLPSNMQKMYQTPVQSDQKPLLEYNTILTQFNPNLNHMSNEYKRHRNIDEITLDNKKIRM